MFNFNHLVDLINRKTSDTVNKPIDQDKIDELINKEITLKDTANVFIFTKDEETDSLRRYYEGSASSHYGTGLKIKIIGRRTDFDLIKNIKGNCRKYDLVAVVPSTNQQLSTDNNAFWSSGQVMLITSADITEKKTVKYKLEI